MNKFTLALASLSLALCALTAKADTPAEAKALLDDAVALFKAKGKDGALKEINAGGKWTKGTLYVVVAQYDGMMVGHAANDKIPGKNMLEAKDAAGTPFVKQTITNVKAAGTSALDLRWGNPVTKQIADATMFAKSVPGQDLYVGAVVFK
jgi:signal transduction histidine kinase